MSRIVICLSLVSVAVLAFSGTASAQTSDSVPVAVSTTQAEVDWLVALLAAPAAPSWLLPASESPELQQSCDPGDDDYDAEGLFGDIRSAMLGTNGGESGFYGCAVGYCAVAAALSFVMGPAAFIGGCTSAAAICAIRNF